MNRTMNRTMNKTKTAVSTPTLHRVNLAVTPISPVQLSARKEMSMLSRRRTLALVTLSIYPLLAVPLLLGSGMRIALADSFTFTTIDAPGAIETRPFGVNADDLIVGVFGGPHLTGECWDLEFFSGPSLDC